MFVQFSTLCLLLHGINTQIVDDSYVCVPSGFCDNNKTPSEPSDIDPRILTSGEVCTDGTISCYVQGPNSFCGERFIQQTSTADGPADRGVYPWQAYLRNSTNSYAGSGVLIDNYHVLTAAHKVANSQRNPSGVSVVMGVYNPKYIGITTQTRIVERIYLHDLYNSSSLVNDIAILKMENPFQLSEDNINTACLPQDGSSFIGQKCVVAGWGQTSFTSYNAPTSSMKQVYVNITTYNRCRSSYLKILGNKVDYYLDEIGEICAGGESMRDACTHDGGSPLICPTPSGKNVIAGLVIWGKNCGQPGVYGVYVNVASYIDWIESIISDD